MTKLQTNKKLKFIRKYFPITKHSVYFANANYFPINKLVLKEVFKELKKKKYGKIYSEHFETYSKMVKGKISSLYSSDKNKILFYRNSTELFLFIVLMLKNNKIIKSSEEILTYEENFPSFKNLLNSLSSVLKLKVRTFKQNNKPIDIDILKNEISDKTKIFLFSTVDYLSGTRNKMEQFGSFLKEKGIITIADITQQIGLYPFSLDKFDIDFYFASFHKGFMGLDGGAFGYFKTYPYSPFIGWRNINLNNNHYNNSFKVNNTNNILTEEASYDIGPIASISGSIEFIKKISFNKIVKYNSRNWQFLKELFLQLKKYENNNFQIITPIDNESYIEQFSVENKDYYYKYPSTIFSIKINNKEIKDKLLLFFKENNIEINFFGKILRISFSFYNSKEEFNLLAKGLKNILINK